MAHLINSPRERRVEELPPAAVVGSMGLHAIVVAVVVWGAARMAIPPPPQVYRVDLVPAASTAPVREMPAPDLPKPKPELKKEMRKIPAEPVAVEKPRRTVRKEPETAPKKKEEEKPKAETPSTRTPASAATGKKSADIDTPVRLEGAPFPYPDYLENIIIQIRRHWRPPSGDQHLRAELAFTIHRDGSVDEIRWIRRSGNAAFDLEARGAIETAGLRGAFGPLPQRYPADQLRVSFFFDPSQY